MKTASCRGHERACGCNDEFIWNQLLATGKKKEGKRVEEGERARAKKKRRKGRDSMATASRSLKAVILSARTRA